MSSLGSESVELESRAPGNSLRPVEVLYCPKALQGVIEEFISRDGIDYGEIEVSPGTKFRRVKHKLEKGLAVLVFDDETETTNIFSTDNPILKKMKELTE
jgi:hypothetical protein